MVSTQGRIRLPMLIKIRRMHPRSILAIEEDHHALADVNEEADCAATTAIC